MRRWTSAALMGAAFAMAAMPVQAQSSWKSYVNKDLGFSFMAPSEVTAGTGAMRGAVAGPHQTIVYRAESDNIEYKVTVLSLQQAQAEAASILGEREYMFQDKKKVLMDVIARVEPGKNSVYGRKLVVENPDGKERTMGAFYFTKGRLISLEATVGANGDPQSPDLGRFIDSIAFDPIRAEPGATELQAPELD